MSHFVRSRWSGTTLAVLLVTIVGTSSRAADHYGLQPTSIELASIGPLAFGPDGVLFVSDPKRATIHAIDTKPHRPATPIDTQGPLYEVSDLKSSLAALVDREAADIEVIDLAIDPEAGSLFLAIKLGDRAALATVTPAGDVRLVSLEKVVAASSELPNAPADKVTGEGRRASNKRMESVTDLAFAEGHLLVSGLAGESPVSTVRAIGFPFRETGSAAQIEIFHAAHGRNEDYAAIRAFIPIQIDGKPNLLAGYTCTPLVRFSLDSLQKGEKVKGTTIAELGNQNRPIDMIVYERDGNTHLLVTNTARGVMKINTADVATQGELTEPVRGGGTAGVPFEQIESLAGVVQLAKLGDAHGVILQETADQRLVLTTIDLP